MRRYVRLYLREDELTELIKLVAHFSDPFVQEQNAVLAKLLKLKRDLDNAPRQ